MQNLPVPASSAAVSGYHPTRYLSKEISDCPSFIRVDDVYGEPVAIARREDGYVVIQGITSTRAYRSASSPSLEPAAVFWRNTITDDYYYYFLDKKANDHYLKAVDLKTGNLVLNEYIATDSGFSSITLNASNTLFVWKACSDDGTVHHMYGTEYNLVTKTVIAAWDKVLPVLEQGQTLLFKRSPSSNEVWRYQSFRNRDSTQNNSVPVVENRIYMQVGAAFDGAMTTRGASGTFSSYDATSLGVDVASSFDVVTNSVLGSEIFFAESFDGSYYATAFEEVGLSTLSYRTDAVGLSLDRTKPGNIVSSPFLIVDSVNQRVKYARLLGLTQPTNFSAVSLGLNATTTDYFPICIDSRTATNYYSELTKTNLQWYSNSSNYGVVRLTSRTFLLQMQKGFCNIFSKVNLDETHYSEDLPESLNSFTSEYAPGIYAPYGNDLLDVYVSDPLTVSTSFTSGYFLNDYFAIDGSSIVDYPNFSSSQPIGLGAIAFKGNIAYYFNTGFSEIVKRNDFAILATQSMTLLYPDIYMFFVLKDRVYVYTTDSSNLGIQVFDGNSLVLLDSGTFILSQSLNVVKYFVDPDGQKLYAYHTDEPSSIFRVYASLLYDPTDLTNVQRGNEEIILDGQMYFAGPETVEIAFVNDNDILFVGSNPFVTGVSSGYIVDLSLKLVKNTVFTDTLLAVSSSRIRNNVGTTIVSMGGYIYLINFHSWIRYTEETPSFKSIQTVPALATRPVLDMGKGFFKDNNYFQIGLSGLTRFYTSSLERDYLDKIGSVYPDADNGKVVLLAFFETTQPPLTQTLDCFTSFDCSTSPTSASVYDNFDGDIHSSNPKGLQGKVYKQWQMSFIADSNRLGSVLEIFYRSLKNGVIISDRASSPSTTNSLVIFTGIDYDYKGGDKWLVTLSLNEIGNGWASRDL